jgi:hypothetical protein
MRAGTATSESGRVHLLKQKLSVPPEKERLAAEAKKPGTVSQPKYYGNIRGIAQPATYGVGAPKK